MTNEEYKKLKSAMYKKYKAGEITNYAYIQWKKKNKPDENGGGAASPAPAAEAKKAAGWTAAEHNQIYDFLYEQKEKAVITDAELSVYVEQLDKLESSGMKPDDAEKIMKDAVQFSYLNGMDPGDAVEAAKNAPQSVTGSKAKMDDQDHLEIYNALWDKVDAGIIKSDDIDELSKKLHNLHYYAGATKEEAEKLLNDACEFIHNNGMTVQDAIWAAEEKAPAPGATPAAAAEKITYPEIYDWLVDISDEEIDSMDAMSLTDMVEFLKKSNVDPATAKAQIESAVNLIKNNGFTAEEAMSVAGGYKPGMQPSKPSKPQYYKVSDDELTATLDELYKKVQKKTITQEQYDAFANKAMTMQTSNKTLDEIKAEIGLDPGTLATEKAVDDLTDELEKVYGQAAKEIKKQLEDFEDAYTMKLDKKFHELQAGEITQAGFDAWVKNQLMTAEIMRNKLDQLTGVTLNANQKAMGIVNGKMVGVFAENANYQAYEITKNAKLNLMFSVYDEHTAQKLLKEKPELMPRREVNGKKDNAWNREKMAHSILQAVIQGESIPKAAKRIAAETASTNMNAMVRYARTAMTCAQNAGRQEMLQRAKGMGINVKKTWMATLDSRTRDSHRAMDGVPVEVDEKFHTPLGSEMEYPGDFSGGAKPGDIWNCRCTMVYEYKGFERDPSIDQRIQYDEYYTTEVDAKGKEHKVFHRESSLIANMDYPEWKAAKEGSKLNDLSAAKFALGDAQKALIKAKVKEDKVYKDIWKDDVTLADYPDKKDSIQAKRDYYTAEIDKLNQAISNGYSWASPEKVKELQKKLKLLNEFEKNGQLLEKRNKALQAVQDIYNDVGFTQKTATAPTIAAEIKKKAKKAAVAKGLDSAAGELKTPFGPEAYTKERKDKALWSTDKRYVDKMMRPRTGEVWNKATEAEKDAIVEYTQSYSKYNEPLRGIEYGTSRYLGVGNTDLNASYANNGNRMNKMTDLIGKCSYDHDMWLQRGCNWGGMDKFFNCSMDLLRNGTQKELEQALLGKTPTEYAFGSMGSAKGKGFSTKPIIMNIYAPSGTKMMYVEPFSHYGGHMYDWDGKQEQSSFGDEFETILQQGTQFRITKIERKGRSGTIYMDLEVINQDNQQRWKKKK